MTFKWDTDLKPKVQLPDGIYNFECVNAQKSLTKKKIKPNGEVIDPRPMMILDLAIYSNEGKKFDVKIWITQEMSFLLKHFFDAAGCPEIFEKGECEPHEFIGKCGLVRTYNKEEEYQGEPKINIKVGDFVTEEKANSWKEKNGIYVDSSKKEDDFINDPIPF